MTIRLLSYFCLILILTVSTQAKEWRDIVPMESTRQDVERLLGPPLPQFKPQTIYDIENERAFISYSEGACEKGWPYGWNIPPDTVTSISVSPMKIITRTELGLNLNGYASYRDPHMYDYVIYNNEELGIGYRIYEGGGGDKGRIMETHYFGANFKDECLHCPKEPTGLPEGRPIADHLSKFDSYGDISFIEEKKRLDRLTLIFLLEPDKEIYIIVYAGKRAYKGEAKERAERAKKYVLRKRGIKAERIWATDGGYKEELDVDLYILPRGGTVPPVYPRVRPSKVEIIDRGKKQKL